MTADKWRFFNGRVYRLAGEYDLSVDAIRKAKELSISNHVQISHTIDDTWVVYWRSREEEPACKPSHYRVI